MSHEGVTSDTVLMPVGCVPLQDEAGLTRDECRRPASAFIVDTKSAPCASIVVLQRITGAGELIIA